MCARLTTFALFLGASMLSAETVSDRLDHLESDLAKIKVLLQKMADENHKQFGSSNPQPAKDSDQSYRIRSGDSYWSIARRYKTTVSALLGANPGINPHRLTIGTKITIPGGRAPHKRSSAIRTHRVKSGDILGRISIEYGIPMKQLLSANPGLNPQILKIGTILNIPGASSKLPPIAHVKKVSKRPQPLGAPKIAVQPTQRNDSELSKTGEFKKIEIRKSEEGDLKKPRLVVIEENLRFFEIAELYETTVMDLNKLNKRNLSPKQMIKSGSQFYILSR